MRELGESPTSGIGIDDPQNMPLRIAQDGDTTHVRDLYRLHKRQAPSSVAFAVVRSGSSTAT